MINDSKREKTEVWASWCGVHQYPISLLSPLDEQKSERDLIRFHQQPINPAPTSSMPFSFWNPLSYGCASFSARLSVPLMVSVPLHLCLLPLSVLPHVCLLSSCISLSFSLCLPHSGFLSAKNRSANHTTPGELSWSTVIKNVLMGHWKDLASLVSMGNLGFQFVLLQLSSHPAHFLVMPLLCTSI